MTEHELQELESLRARVDELEREAGRRRAARAGVSKALHKMFSRRTASWAVFLAFLTGAMVFLYAADITSTAPHTFSTGGVITAADVTEDITTLFTNDDNINDELFWSAISGGISYTAGNVGIGTSVPSFKLDVEGSTDGSYAKFGSVYPIYMLGSHPTIGFNIYQDGSGINRFGNGSSNSYGMTIAVNRDWGGMWINTSNAGNVNAIATMTTRFTILNSGNVGIGTSSPGYTLDINGTAHCTSGSWSSDGRFKKDVAPVTGAMDTLTRLNGVSFQWRVGEFEGKDFPDGLQYGLVAQDVEKVLPEIVSTRNGEKSIAYIELIPLLIEGMKEQKAQKDAEIQALRDENAALKAHLDALEARMGE